MQILVLSFYYHPDLSAGSFRTTALVAALRERAPPQTRIDVVTTLPNRYHTFSREAPETETDGGVRIRRIGLPAHRSDMAGQSRAFLRFARQVSRHVHAEKYDVVFATSSRLMTAMLGARVARKMKARLYLDIRDIFVDTIADVLPGWMSWPVRTLFSMVERWTIRSADRINFVSRGFEPYFRRRYGDLRMSWFTNGVDEEFIDLSSSPRTAAAARAPVTVLYAGNLGESQALHYVLPGLARALRGHAKFVVIGDGGRRAQLEAALAAHGVDNVELRKPVQRAQLIEAYRAADILFLHLGDQPAFEKVLPSKLFEYAALGKPVLAGVGGYAARFVREEVSNAAVFAPCDVEGGVRAFGSLTIADTPRTDFIAKYRRTSIARAMADEVLSLAASGQDDALS